MSSLSDYLTNVCLNKIKRNQLVPSYIMYDNHVYLIVFKSYESNDETINFEAIKFSKSTSDDYPTIDTNLNLLKQFVH